MAKTDAKPKTKKSAKAADGKVAAPAAAQNGNTPQTAAPAETLTL